MGNIHRAPPLALTLRGYIQHAPERWRAHMAAAAEQVEEVARLREELDAERTRHEYTANVMRGEADRSDKADAEIDRLRAELAAAMQWNADAKRVMAEMRDSTLIIRERDEARAELAAARALLREAVARLQPDWDDPLTEPTLSGRIEAALAGKDAPVTAAEDAVLRKALLASTTPTKDAP